MSALLICALALGLSYVIGSRELPCTLIGSLSSDPSSSNLAPTPSSGSVTLRIGRERRESSPVRVAVAWLPARRPRRRRAVVPLLPQSIISIGSSGVIG